MGATRPARRWSFLLGRRLRRGFVKGILIGLVVLAACVVLFWVFESGPNAEVTGIGSALRWVMITLVIGEPAFSTETGPGLVLFFVVVIAGVGIVAMGIGLITTKLVDLLMRRDAGLGESADSGHIVICGWSERGHEIIRELHADEVNDKRPIVILADIPTNPTSDELVTFIRGNPSRGEDLMRAGIDRADTALILADQGNPNHTADDVDAKTLLSTLAVESINPDCYSCVEVIRSENRQHFERTHADEIIVSAEITGALLASSAVNHGMSGVVTDLLTHPVGSEFYVIPAPPDVVGTTFSDALISLKRDHDCVLVAVAERDGKYELNPPGDRMISAGNRLLIIAESDAAAAVAGSHAGAGG